MKKLCLLLVSMLLILFSSRALADGDESFLGTWYGYRSGNPLSVTFEEKGVYRLIFCGFPEEHKGKYTLKDNQINMKYKKMELEFVVGENELVAVYSDHYFDASLPDGLFTHEPIEIVLPSQEKLKAEKPEQLGGIWKLRYLIWWDNKYLYDMEHLSGDSVWSLTSDPETGIYYVHIDTENNRVEFLNAKREVMDRHSLRWNQGTFVDSFWKRTYTLMADGSLAYGDKQSSLYLYKEGE